MSKMSESNSNEIKRFKWEYNQFLEFVKQRKPQRAMIYAKGLGIDRRTLNKWMEQPELRDAMAEAVDAILEEMQKAGKNDWRMWDKMLELSGITTVKELDVTSDGEKLEGAIISFETKPTED
jgi:hypothetical protein